MNTFKTRISKLSGTTYAEVYKAAYALHRKIEKRSKRRPYIRSLYFKKSKIFLGLFWQHLRDKFGLKEKIRRLKFFPCALELIEKSRLDPISKDNPNKSSELLHRFKGETRQKEVFFVQIKEDKRSGEKFLISVFPEN
jgi:hypothetical protein